MRGMLGTVLPYANVVISPCDADGVPAADEAEIAAAHFETKALILAWLGRCMMFAFGDVEPRAIDPANPRQYLAGNL